MQSTVSHLECSRCRSQYDHRERHTTCKRCDAPLLVEYDTDHIARTTERDGLAGTTMWRYRALLPVEGAPVSLGEGFTPIIPVPTAGLTNLLLKNEGLNPTGTFKDRGASCGISRARELGITDVALPTAGNAGGAWAAYGAAAGITVHVAMPMDAPEANKSECLLHGAELTLVDGLISDAAKVIRDGIAKNGWFDASTLREPYRIEGKKTLGLEITEQLGGSMPDAIVYPAGGGVGIIGIYRALQQLRALGWVEGEMPKLIVVQAEGCAPIVKAFDDGKDESEYWEHAHTIAAGLRVPKAFGDFLVLRAVRETGGTCIALSDEEILSSMKELGRAYGIAAAPEGAATFGAARKLREGGVLRDGDRVVLINTGSAAKYGSVVASLK